VQISIPLVTRPKTVCLLSNQGVGTVVMKTTKRHEREEGISNGVNKESTYCVVAGEGLTL
jgi:hypothetical protein